MARAVFQNHGNTPPKASEQRLCSCSFYERLLSSSKNKLASQAAIKVLWTHREEIWKVMWREVKFGNKLSEKLVVRFSEFPSLINDPQKIITKSGFANSVLSWFPNCSRTRRFSPLRGNLYKSFFFDTLSAMINITFFFFRFSRKLLSMLNWFSSPMATDGLKASITDILTDNQNHLSSGLDVRETVISFSRMCQCVKCTVVREDNEKVGALRRLRVWVNNRERDLFYIHLQLLTQRREWGMRLQIPKLVNNL